MKITENENFMVKLPRSADVIFREKQDHENLILQDTHKKTKIK